MKRVEPDKLVLFGAGKIGRSFIGQLFSRAGYRVVFVDVDKAVIDELNRRGNYNVVIKGEKDEILNIGNVRGIMASEEQDVIHEIATAGILAVSVGSSGLPSSISLIAKGLAKRYNISRESPLDIIIAENIRDGAEFVRNRLKAELPYWYPLESLVGLVETSIGKMVPIMTRKDMEKDMLQVFAEPYNTLILDKKAFINPVPEVAGLAPKDHMKAWVDRKLFIHNLGHSSAAYCGFYHYPELQYMYEILAHIEVADFTRSAMLQSSGILQKLHPGVFTDGDLTEHIDDLISRFQNRALGDTVFRVGCDLPRKLGSNDRLMAPFHTGLKYGLPVEYIAEAFFYGLFFRAKDEAGSLHKGDSEFIEMLGKDGLEETLRKVSHMEPNEIKIMMEQFLKHKKSTIILS